MARIDYDCIAPAFDRRYAHQSYAGIERALARFLGSHRHQAIVEIGCGTGHWLRLHADAAAVVAGADRSMAMLERARVANTRAALVHATAELLPFASGCFDRAFCINA